MLKNRQAQKYKSTHFDLIRRIKDKLQVGRAESTFVSRKSILEYLGWLSGQNSEIRGTLSPASLQQQLAAAEQKCETDRQKLVKAEQKEKAVIQAITTADEQLHFVRDQVAKNTQQCQYLQSQINSLNEQRLLQNSKASEVEQVTQLMDKLIGYFEAPEQENTPLSSKHSGTRNLFDRLGLGVTNPLARNQGRAEDPKPKDRSENSQSSFNMEFQKLLQLDLSQEKLRQQVGL